MKGYARSIDAWRSALVALACAWVAGTAAGQASLQPTEAVVKAAYLYRFLAHVEWPPPHSPRPTSRCPSAWPARPEVSEELQRVVAGRHVNGRAVNARHLADDEALDGLHVLFIGRAVRQPRRLIERLRGRPVLIVMEGASSLDAGAMLSLVPVEGRIRFEASPLSAERAGLRLGARLLALAERVVTR